MYWLYSYSLIGVILCVVFWVPPMWGVWWEMIWAILRWKTLSVKVPINKEDFGFMDEFLVRWRFDFWVVKLGKCLILVGFDDMGAISGLRWENWDFAWFCWDFWGLGKDGFLSWCVDESAIGLAAFPALLISFNYPQLGKTMDNRYILTILL